MFIWLDVLHRAADVENDEHDRNIVFNEFA